MLLLDAGAFLAIERNDRDVIALIKSELIANRAPKTHGGIVAPPAMLDVWGRGGLKQTRADSSPQTRAIQAVERHGFISVVAVNSELEHHQARLQVPGKNRLERKNTLARGRGSGKKRRAFARRGGVAPPTRARRMRLRSRL